MKNTNFARTAIAAALFAASGASMAADYFVVVPVQGKSVQLAGITVTLNNYVLPGGIVGLPYSGFNFNQVLSVTGDPSFSPSLVSWALASGQLPAGLTLNSNGTLAGTPSASGTSSFVLRAMYKTKTGMQTYQVAVTNLTVALSSAVMPAGVQGATYSYDLKPRLSVVGDAAYNGSGVTWSLASGVLPAGLSLSADGVISGVPTAENSGTPFTVQAAYKTKNGQQAYSVSVAAITVSLTSATLPSGKFGTAYSFDFKPYLAVTGDAAYSGSGVTWSVASGTLPAGLSLNSSTGVLSGTPSTSTAGSSFTVQAAYKTKSGQTAYSVVIAAVPVVAIAGSSPTTYRYENGTVAASCKEYRDGKTGYSSSTTTGYYQVNMGSGVETVYCDMTTSGGGWTLVARSGGASPAFANCSATAGTNSAFGWSVARGSPWDTANPYSMGVFNRNLAFTEVLIGGASGTSNSWNAYVYKQQVPANFKTALTNTEATVPEAGFGMSLYMGHTTDTTQYFFRDVQDGYRASSQPAYGLHADGWLTCYGDGPNNVSGQTAPASFGGNLNYRHGLLMVR